MSKGTDNVDKTLRDIFENLGNIFRYFLPGVVVVGTTYLAYPNNTLWPKSIDSWKILTFVGIITITIGNVWNIFIRYGLHQIIDMILYYLNIDGPSMKYGDGYIDTLGRFVSESIKTSNVPLRRHVNFRASAVLLMYSIGVLAIFFSFRNEGPGNFFFDNANPIRAGGLIALCVGIWQNIITRRIDWYTVHPPMPKYP